jgi:hypothetical protein
VAGSVVAPGDDTAGVEVMVEVEVAVNVLPFPVTHALNPVLNKVNTAKQTNIHLFIFNSKLVQYVWNVLSRIPVSPVIAKLPATV